MYNHTNFYKTFAKVIYIYKLWIYMKMNILLKCMNFITIHNNWNNLTNYCKLSTYYKCLKIKKNHAYSWIKFYKAIYFNLPIIESIYKCIL